MTLNRRAFIGGSLLATGALFTPRGMAAPASQLPSTTPVAGVMPAQEPSHSPAMLEKALAALDRHSDQVVHRDRLGIADFSAPSGEYRFHLVNVEQGAIERSLLVSHGRGSDPRNSGFAKRFSNLPGSHASSLGSYLTGEAYVGKHGRSRRLHGLEDRNDLAFDRAIVMHGAGYVDRGMARTQGRVGRSLGCFAFERREIDHVLDWLGRGRLLFALD